MNLKSWKELAQDALFVQGASNLSGIAISFADVVVNVKRNIESDMKTGSRTGKHYGYSNHPVIVLWVTQFAHLAGTGLTDSDVYDDAYQWCAEKANS